MLKIRRRVSKKRKNFMGLKIKIITLFYILTVLNNSEAQITIPSPQIDLSKYKKIKNRLTILESQQKENMKTLLTNNDSLKKSIDDSIKKNEAEIIDTENELKKLITESNKFSLYGNAALASSDKISDISAVTNLLGVVNFTYTLTGAIGFNIKGVQPESISKDSIDLNNLMFPDAGSAGFFASLGKDLFCHKKDDDEIKQYGILYLDFSFKQTNFNEVVFDSSGSEIGKNKYSFSLLNYNLGFKYHWSYRPRDNPKNNVDLTAQAYYNLFNIPEEDVNKFKKLYTDNIDVSFIHSLGFKAVLSFRGVSFFGDFRYNLNTKKLDNENVLKGFVFNVGTRFTTEILGF
jgi:hypothetical protein